MADTTLLYDADCGFCRRALSLVLAWDRTRRVRAVALQSPETVTLLPDMPPERRMASWHLVGDEGEVWSAGSAVAPLLGCLPFGRPLATVAAAAPDVTDRVYGWIARHRTALGRVLGSRACPIADARS